MSFATHILCKLFHLLRKMSCIFFIVLLCLSHRHAKPSRAYKNDGLLLFEVLLAIMQQITSLAVMIILWITSHGVKLC